MKKITTKSQRRKKIQIFDHSVLASLRVLFVLFIFQFNSLYSQEYSDLNINKAKEIIKDRGEVDLKFAKPDNISISQLTRMLSIDNVKHDTIYAYLNRKQFDVFLKFGINFSVIELPQVQSALKSTGSVWDWNKYPTYSEYLSMMDSFARAYPSLCKIIEIGKSVKGRSILFARISSDTTKNKPKVLYSSTMHGNELTGYDLMLRLIDYLLKNYNSNATVTTLIDSLEIWINPLANPDGTYKGGDNDVWHASRNNADSINLNRNFEDPIYGPHPQDSYYAVETINMMNLMSRNHFVLSANFHSGDEVVNYPWDSKKEMHPDSTWFRYISKEYADSVQTYGRPGYFTDVEPSGITDGYAWYAVYGGKQDYETYFKQGREVTIELDLAYMTPENNLNNLWNYNYRSFIHYLEQGMFGIRGFVIDSASHNPVKAKIELVGHDFDSSFVFSDSLTGKYYRLINSGNYNIRFSAPGYFTKEIQNVSVNNRQTTWLDVALTSTNKSGLTIAGKKEFIIFPNPCKRSFQISNSESLPNKFNIEISDLSGKIVGRLSNISTNESVNAEYLPAGIYFLYIRTKSNFVRKKLIIER